MFTPRNSTFLVVLVSQFCLLLICFYIFSFFITVIFYLLAIFSSFGCLLCVCAFLSWNLSFMVKAVLFIKTNIFPISISYAHANRRQYDLVVRQGSDRRRQVFAAVTSVLSKYCPKLLNDLGQMLLITR